MTLNYPANMPIWDPYTITLGNWAWADGAQSVLGPTWATQCTPMAVMHAASGLGELGLGEMGLGEMGGHLRWSFEGGRVPTSKDKFVQYSLRCL